MLTTTWRLFLLLTLLTGYLYPLLITGLAQSCFPWQANGSLLMSQGQVVGSQWIGQEFTRDDYFWSRPSATHPRPYNGLGSGGSNLGPSNPALLEAIQLRIAAQHFVQLPIPVDMVTASASGLDPEISPAAAYYQMERVAQARHIPEADLQALIQAHTRWRTWHILGEPRVNVLELNLALNAKQRSKSTSSS